MMEDDERLNKIEERLAGVGTLGGEVQKLRVLGEDNERQLQLVLEVHGQRFDAIDKRFDAVDERFEAVDERFDAVDKRFDAVDKRFDAVDKRFDAVERRFDEISIALEPLAAIHRFVQAVADEHEARIKALEKHTGIR